MNKPKAEPPDKPQPQAHVWTQTQDKNKTITKENRENIRDKNDDDTIRMEHLLNDGRDGLIAPITSYNNDSHTSGDSTGNTEEEDSDKGES